MYYHGTLSIDPSQLTDIKLVKPNKAFGKMLYYMSLGLASEQEERETFTAVSILQKFNRVFVSLGITNVVRLARDDVDYYLDTEGREDDLKEAMATFENKASTADQKAFDTLRLVLEHEDEVFKYLIQITILRVHKVNEHPIQVTVNGLMKDLRVRSDKDHKEVQDLLRPHFVSQDTYDSYTSQKREHFNDFLDQIEQLVCKHIGVDNVQRTSESRIIHSDEPVYIRQRSRQTNDYCEPVYESYYGCDDYFFYTWFWEDTCRKEGVTIHDCCVVNDKGETVSEVTDKVHDPKDTEDEVTETSQNQSDANADIDGSTTSDSESPSVDTVSAGLVSQSGGGWLSSMFGGGDSDRGSWLDSSTGGDDGGSSCGGGCGGD